MGGPSRESYLRARAALLERIAAKRTRDGVVDLAEWRDAQGKARYLAEKFFGGKDWLLEVRVVEGATEWLELVVVTTREVTVFDGAGIASLDDLPVRFVTKNPARSGTRSDAGDRPAERAEGRRGGVRKRTRRGVDDVRSS